MIQFNFSTYCFIGNTCSWSYQEKRFFLSNFQNTKKYATEFIAVCMYSLVMISIESSETTHFERWKSDTISKTFFFWTFFFFPDKIFFPTKIIFLGFFCLGLDFFETEFCLRLDLVSDYIPQLYFVCNHFNSQDVEKGNYKTSSLEQRFPCDYDVLSVRGSYQNKLST